MKLSHLIGCGLMASTAILPGAIASSEVSSTAANAEIRIVSDAKSKTSGDTRFKVSQALAITDSQCDSKFSVAKFSPRSKEGAEKTISVNAQNTLYLSVQTDVKVYGGTYEPSFYWPADKIKYNGESYFNTKSSNSSSCRSLISFAPEPGQTYRVKETARFGANCSIAVVNEATGQSPADLKIEPRAC